MSDDQLTKNVETLDSLKDLGAFRQIIISKNLIFVNRQEEVRIYRILASGEVVFLKSLGPKELYPEKAQAFISVMDMHISGDDDQLFFVMDYRMGIQQFIIDRSGDSRH